jgi:cyclohexa-1,5-dienecarbonyl-CoA hydratase
MSEKYQNIHFRIEDRVATITFARPPLNIFNIAMMREINKALNECASTRELVAVVFEATTDSRAFSAGVAIEEHISEIVYQMLDAFHGIFRSLELMAKPSVAVVDGAALGGGCELVAQCDIVIASERARFGQPEIKLGVFPPIASVVLPRVIGEKRARELIFTGDLIDAQDGIELGLVNHLVPSSQLQQKSHEILTKLRDLSAAALESASRSITLGRGRSFEDALSKVEDLYLNELMKTHDAHEGIRAFMEKRKPLWRNR